jgi:NTP pyrophosphatase (non-canonical NTP hydrolase)
MNLNEYQQRAMQTRIYRESGALVYPALKLAGEGGEVAQKIGKALYRDGDYELYGMTTALRDALMDELGDVLWYIAALCCDMDVSLNDGALRNQDKLADRAARGKLQGDGDGR